MIEVVDYAIIIGFTSILSTASTTVIVIKANDKLKANICNQITDLLIRVGVLESKHTA